MIVFRTCRIERAHANKANERLESCLVLPMRSTRIPAEGRGRRREECPFSCCIYPRIARFCPRTNLSLRHFASSQYTRYMYVAYKVISHKLCVWIMTSSIITIIRETVRMIILYWWKNWIGHLQSESIFIEFKGLSHTHKYMTISSHLDRIFVGMYIKFHATE